MPSAAIVWTPHARACLLKLYAFLAEKDAVAARRAMGLIKQGQSAGRVPERRQSGGWS